LSELAAREHRSISELLDLVAERERRRQMLDQYNQRMATISSDPAEHKTWQDELALSEASAAEVVERPGDV